jgi:hypothetical protein
MFLLANLQASIMLRNKLFVEHEINSLHSFADILVDPHHSSDSIIQGDQPAVSLDQRDEFM